MHRWLEFPNPVNEKTARTVAACVMVLAAVVVAFDAWWLLPLLATGFLLRVLFGPRVSPIAMLANRVVAPRLGAARLTPGPPKRFAQTIGFVVTAAASLAAFAFDAHDVARALAVLMVVAAGLEAIFRAVHRVPDVLRAHACRSHSAARMHGVCAGRRDRLVSRA
ncbi:MAG: hypothetical protein JWM86_1382 [Thermoleophilia bacterium]|nr:hypothetical protein [Thermoleophilia bacterium]